MDMSMLLTLGIVLMAAGLLLLLADLFIPSGGILTLLALGSMGVGVTLLFRHSMTAGLTALGTLFVALPVIVGLLIKFWPHTPIAWPTHRRRKTPCRCTRNCSISRAATAGR